MAARSRWIVHPIARLLVLAAVARGTPSATAAGIAGTWQGVPLQEVAVAVTPLIGRPLVLDGRIDPTTPITLKANGLSSRELLERLSQQSGSEVVVLRESVRLAPARRRGALQAAEEARTAELAAVAPSLRQALSRRQTGGWPAGATPHDVVKSLVESAGGIIHGLDRIPHDHLRKLALPAMSRAAQLDLLLASYDLRASHTPPAIQVVPLDPRAEPQKPPKLGPPPPRDRMAADETSVFTLEAAAPLEQLLTAICDQTGLTLRLDQPALKRAGITSNRIARVRVEEASLEQLLDAILQPLGLRWQIEGTDLRVTAGSSPPARGSAGVEPPPD